MVESISEADLEILRDVMDRVLFTGMVSLDALRARALTGALRVIASPAPGGPEPFFDQHQIVLKTVLVIPGAFMQDESCRSTAPGTFWMQPHLLFAGRYVPGIPAPLPDLIESGGDDRV